MLARASASERTVLSESPTLVVNSRLFSDEPPRFLGRAKPLNGKAQARRELFVEPINSKSLTQPIRAVIQGREAASPAACVGPPLLSGKPVSAY